MKNIKKQKLSGGHKNDAYKLQKGDQDFFLKEKKYDGFNHQIKYETLKEFDFVPKLIKDKKDQITWEWVEGKHPELNNNDLIEIAGILKKVHNSKVNLPKSNIKKRVVAYFGELKELQKGPKEVYDYYERAYKLAKKIKNTTPTHNDPWINNFIKDNKKIYLVDWEYATMGDKHFDLAFFIDGSWLTSKQEAIFLKSYADYNPKILKEMKFFVNYLTLVWMHRLDKLPFSDKEILENLKK